MAERDPNAFNMRWLADRLDRMESMVDDRFERVTDDIIKSRHGIKEVVDTMAIQMANLVTTTNEHGRRITENERNHASGGERISALERWRSYFLGVVAVLTFLFPTTVGVILWFLGH